MTEYYWTKDHKYYRLTTQDNLFGTTEKPKLKLNLAAKPLTLNTNASSPVAGSALKRILAFEKPKSDDTSQKDITKDAINTKTEVLKKSKQQEAVASNKQVASNKKAASVKVVATPEAILKDKIKRRKKEYFSILTKLQADFPELFSEEVKPLAIGIDLELKKILNGQFPNNQLNGFFHRNCGSFKYKEKLIEGARRFNLDGSPAALVTEKEVPVIVSKPRLNKKSRDASDTV